MLICQSISVVAWTTGGHGQKLLLPVLGMAVPQLGRERRDETSSGRSEGPRLPQPGKRPGWRGGGLLSCAAVSSTNLLVSEAGCKFYFGSQASLPESKRSALAVSLFLFDPPTHPGNRCSGEQGGGCSCSE